MAREPAMTVTALRTMVWAAFGVGVIALPFVAPPSARLVYNATASAPLGWYVVVPVQEPGVGDVVLAHLPSIAARMADERHYLPESVPILKRVGRWRGSGCANGTTCSGSIVSCRSDCWSATVSVVR